MDANYSKREKTYYLNTPHYRIGQVDLLKIVMELLLF